MVPSAVEHTAVTSSGAATTYHAATSPTRPTVTPAPANTLRRVSALASASSCARRASSSRWRCSSIAFSRARFSASVGSRGVAVAGSWKRIEPRTGRSSSFSLFSVIVHSKTAGHAVYTLATRLRAHGEKGMMELDVRPARPFADQFGAAYPCVDGWRILRRPRRHGVELDVLVGARDPRDGLATAGGGESRTDRQSP